MTVPLIDDPALPGFRLMMQPDRLTRHLSASLAEITNGVWVVLKASVVRYRYRKGSRAIIQTDLLLNGPNGCLEMPGSIWFFAGDKANKHAARAPERQETGVPSMFVERHSGGLVCIFPFDRRVPQLKQFANDSSGHSAALLGCPQAGEPQIVRYRPGLGGTYRWRGVDRTAYVKVFSDRLATEAFEQLRVMRNAFRCTSLTIPAPIGAVDALGALSIAEIDKPSLLDGICRLRLPELSALMARTADTLFHLHSSALKPTRMRRSTGFIKRAKHSATLIGAASQTLGQTAQAICTDLSRTARPLDLAPTHMDMKLEHIVPDGDRISLLDLDSIAVSDPMFDLAMLDVRIDAAARDGGCHIAQAAAARTALLKRYFRTAPSPSGARYRWLRAVASLQIAKHHVQHPTPGWNQRAAAALADTWTESPAVFAD